MITPSNSQKTAIDKIKQWFHHESHTKQIFRLFGYAGTGKSTVLSFALEDLGITHFIENDYESPAGQTAVTATFTGKAALVLRQKGTPARTIHSLIYTVTTHTDEQIANQEKRIKEAEEKARGIQDVFDAASQEAIIQAMREELAEMKKPRFMLNPDSPAAFCDLIVLDEVSMVGPDLAADLMSFGKPILVLGDPGQLPPIKGEGAFTQQAPDIMLTEIHRQAAESAIIRLATMARNGQPIAYGAYDEYVAKLRKGDVTPHDMLKGGQTICGRNATRLDLNNAMRRAAGFSGALPSSSDEKIICLKNQNQIGLINGMFLRVDEIEDPQPDSSWFSCRVTEADEVPGQQPISSNVQMYKGHFLDHFDFDPKRADRDWKIRREKTEATFGWAITCHKSQGSQWKNVVIYDDGLGRTAEDRNRWLYTAITRAERGLVLLA